MKNTDAIINAPNDAFQYFDEESISAMVEFSKAILNSDGEIKICMARKAARLYDLLGKSGAAISKNPPLHQYFLEHSPEIVKDRSVTLIDDTVILGTTLAKTKKILIENGAKSVETIVLATDSDHWSRDLIIPDHNFLELNHQQMITFCAAEVQALNCAGIPYLSDFPFFESISLSKSNFSQMQGVFGWEIFHTAQRTGLNETRTSGAFSVIPSGSMDRALDRVFGRALSHSVEIAKVRCFSTLNHDGKYVVRIVPVVTFSPLSESTVDSLFSIMAETIEEISGCRLARLRSGLSTTRSKLRFCQYILSCIVGCFYTNDVQQALRLRKNFSLDRSEALRIFGGWHAGDLSRCHDAIRQICDQGFCLSRKGNSIKKAKLPVQVAMVSKEECDQFLAISPIDKTERFGRSLRADLEGLFLKLHQVHELPARQEVKSNGAAIFDMPASQVPHRDRLSYGLDWGTIASRLLEREGLRVTPKRKVRLSTLLDQLIDDGIAVPILSHRNGVFFRAYRHGEDAEFANQEASLAFDVVKGYCESTNEKSVDRITLEKLLVSLIRVGVQKKFLVPVHGLHGSSGGVARVGYHLHGAVVNLPSDASPLADSRNSWLSRHLVNGGVLSLNEDKSYSTGKRPTGATISAQSSAEAKMLGNLLGILTTTKQSNGNWGLSKNELVLLTTCPQSRHVALAAVAELKIMLDGIHNRIRKWGRKKLTLDVCRELLKLLRNDNARTAAFSAAMKISAHKDKRVKKIFADASILLHSIPTAGPVLGSAWETAWGPIVNSNFSHQDEHYRVWIDNLHNVLSDLTLGLLTLEAALASAVPLVGKERKSQFQRTCDVIERNISNLSPSPDAAKLHERLKNTIDRRTPINNVQETAKYAIEFCLRRYLRSHELIAQICDVDARYGRADRRTNFKYVLWYDIIDSTGQKSGLVGDALRDYRCSVRDFKDGANRLLKSAQADLKQRRVVLYPWASGISSKDDEKNLFFGGPRCAVGLLEVLKTLVNEANSKSIKLRVLVTNTDFAGYQAHKYEQEPSVEGESFWEHGSRVKQKLKQKEVGNTIASWLWFCDRTTQQSDLVEWSNEILDSPTTGEITTEIENYVLHTRYRGGMLKEPKKY